MVAVAGVVVPTVARLLFVGLSADCSESRELLDLHLQPVVHADVVAAQCDIVVAVVGFCVVVAVVGAIHMAFGLALWAAQLGIDARCERV